MMLTLLYSPSGTGAILRDTSTRKDVFIDQTQMLSIAQSLIDMSRNLEQPPKPRKGRRV